MNITSILNDRANVNIIFSRLLSSEQLLNTVDGKKGTLMLAWVYNFNVNSVYRIKHQWFEGIQQLLYTGPKSNNVVIIFTF